MKEEVGTIISDKMNKAVVIAVERKYRHHLYGKIMKLKKKLHAVNEIGAKVGDKVKVVETRPVSKTIAFRVVQIIGTKGTETAKEKKK